jgi:predicted NBD/HSP70 family sugar kinase
LQRYEQRLAKSLAHVVNILDPDVIVLGGGMSNVGRRLYRTLPHLDEIASGCLAASVKRRSATSAAWRFQRCTRRRLAVAA